MSREAKNQYEFSVRQYEVWKLRAQLCQVEAQVAAAEGNLPKANERLAAARNWLNHVNDANEGLHELMKRMESL